jgi:hypothetical protein
MNIPEGTVLARAKREAWTQQRYFPVIHAQRIPARLLTSRYAAGRRLYCGIAQSLMPADLCYPVTAEVCHPHTVSIVEDVIWAAAEI